MGNNDSIPAGFSTDLTGNNRIWGNAVDMGAYEYTFSLGLGNDTTVCPGSAIILDAQNQGSSYLWNNGDTTQSITVNSTGDYSVAVTNSWGTLTDTINVVFSAIPNVNLGNDMTIGTTSFTLDAGNSGATYLWSTGETTQTITIHASGTYSVMVTNATGCSSSDTVTITMSPNAIESIEALVKTITIYPNPSKDIINIGIKDLKLMQTVVLLTDIYGRTIRMSTIDNELTQLSLSELEAGMYILKFENGASAKIIKE